MLVWAPIEVSGQYYFTPLSRDFQVRLEKILLDTNVSFHHAIRPFSNVDLSRVNSNWRDESDFTSLLIASNKGFKNWVLRKLFNESFVIIDDEDYHIEANPILNLELGYSSSNRATAFLNTRGVWIEGSLGRQFSFYTMVAENQGRFPDYYQDFYTSNNVVLGWGKLNQTSESGILDFPMVMGGIAYNPSKYFTFSLSQGKQFFGEGYRSMILSDYAMPNANFKIETDFGDKVKYVNLYSIYLDPQSSINGFNRKKYTSFHYLSWNISPKLNLSFFESMVWVGDSSNPNQGFDIHFLNPIIMYRQVEKVIGGKGGNAMIGLAGSYQPFRYFRIYGQLAIDDFSIEALQQLSSGHWLNFYSGQFGFKLVEPFNSEGLFMLMEYNTARPFMYAHRTAESNYTHQLLPLAHPWGSSFRELVTRVNYHKDRWILDLSLAYGEAADDPEGRNLGNNLFLSIFDRQGGITGYKIANGNSFNLLVGKVSLSYVLNAKTGSSLEMGYRFRYQYYRSRNFQDKTMNWIYFGFRTPLFDQYLDF